MGRSHLALSCAVACTVAACLAAGGTSAPGQEPYTGRKATGQHVIAFWRFEPGAVTKDSSGNGHELKLRGKARGVKDGRFGGGLESFPAGPKNDKAQGALTMKKHPDLSPQGAFTIELWLRPKPQMAEQRTVFLLDNKYYHYHKDLPRANAGYVFTLRRRGGGWVPTAMLGFGADSEEFTAKPIELAAETWHHLAFTYDGAGTGRICVDGKDIGEATVPSRGAIAPAKYPLAIGGRYGSIHHGCAAILDEVRITRGVRVGGLAVTIGTRDGRTSFRRMEDAGPVLVRITNHTDQALTDGRARIAFRSKQETALPDLLPRKPHVVEVPLDTRLRPDRYELSVAASAQAEGRTLEAERVQPIFIVPRPRPHQMPVVMWGGGDLERVKAIGFTHHIQHAAEYARVWEAGRAIPQRDFPNAAAIRENLNRHLAEGVGVVIRLDPGRWLERQGLCLRVDRSGEPYDKAQACAALPKVQDFGYRCGESVAQAFGHFPALQSALIHTEIRGHTQPCFHKHDRQAFQKHAGFPIPRQVAGKRPPHYTELPDFPSDRVLPDDHPLLVYTRWFWKNGDGWNPLHTQVSDGLHATGRDDLWAFYDPAVRVPSFWGSG